LDRTKRNTRQPHTGVCVCVCCVVCVCSFCVSVCVSFPRFGPKTSHARFVFASVFFCVCVLCVCLFLSSQTTAHNKHKKPLVCVCVLSLVVVFLPFPPLSSNACALFWIRGGANWGWGEKPSHCVFGCCLLTQKALPRVGNVWRVAKGAPPGKTAVVVSLHT
jgi:cell division protein FtsW (lipid II flippase)